MTSKQQPKSLQSQSLNLPAEPMAGLSIELAKTTEDYRAAFELVYQSYREEGYTPIHATKMRATRYHSSPNTYVVVAKIDGIIVGTGSLIGEGENDLPLADCCDLSEIKKTSSKLIEISSLAIDKNHRGEKGKVLWPLLAFIFRLAQRNLAADALIIGVNPAHTGFYGKVFGFQQFAPEHDDYGLVSGAAMVPMILPLVAGAQWIKKRYKSAQPASNLHDFLFHRDLSAFFTSIEDQLSWRHQQLNTQSINQLVSMCEVA